MTFSLTQIVRNISSTSKKFSLVLQFQFSLLKIYRAPNKVNTMYLEMSKKISNLKELSS